MNILKSLLKIILLNLYLISYITPRNKKKWVFGSYQKFNDNSKYLYLYIKENFPDIQSIWITTKKIYERELNEIGINAFYKWSFNGLYHLLTSKYYFFSAYLSDINFYTSGNTTKINLWHGIGLKKIEFNIDSGPLQKIYKKSRIINFLRTPEKFIRPNWVLSSSPLMSEHLFHRAFRIKLSQCLEYGYPRNDLFFWDDTKLSKHINRYEDKSLVPLINKCKEFDKIIIYMPTWRDSNSDFIKKAGFDLLKLNDFCKKHNYLFIFKLHINTKINIEKGEETNNISYFPQEADIYPFLPFTDILITDYSSIYYDYILMRGKKAILFPFDIDEYLEDSRAFTLPYQKYSGCPKLYNMNSLLEEIIANKTYNNETLIKQFWGNYKGQASNVITNYFLNN